MKSLPSEGLGFTTPPPPLVGARPRPLSGDSSNSTSARYYAPTICPIETLSPMSYGTVLTLVTEEIICISDVPVECTHVHTLGPGHRYGIWHGHNPRNTLVHVGEDNFSPIRGATNHRLPERPRLLG